MTHSRPGKASQSGDRAKGELFRGVVKVPYDDNSELPQSVRDYLPEHAQTIYREAFNHAWVQYAHDPTHEEIAHRVTWSAVKRKYRKAGERWVPKG